MRCATSIRASWTRIRFRRCARGRRASCIRDPKAYTRIDHEILDAITALPGVQAAGFTSTLPMEGAPFTIDAPVAIEGRPLAGGNTPPPRRMKFVSPGYLAAMGTRIVAGRDLTWADIDAGGKVALVSEDFAREIAGEPAAALGMRIRPPAEHGRVARSDRRGAEPEGRRRSMRPRRVSCTGRS